MLEIFCLYSNISQVEYLNMKLAFKKLGFNCKIVNKKGSKGLLSGLVLSCESSNAVKVKELSNVLKNFEKLGPYCIKEGNVVLSYEEGLYVLKQKGSILGGEKLAVVLLFVIKRLILAFFSPVYSLGGFLKNKDKFEVK